ncbi:MAG: hypothetical protein WA885_04840 [Phormidesmis sp.]
MTQPSPPAGRDPIEQETRSHPPRGPADPAKRLPIERDLTNRLVGVFVWFSLATSAGCVMEMAETKAPPNVASAMKLGLVGAIACAYKDLERTRMPLSLLKAPQKFFSKLIVRLDDHSVQLQENTVGQEQLERKIDGLTRRVDTLTLAMVKPPSFTQAEPSLSPVNALSAPSAPSAPPSADANGHSEFDLVASAINLNGNGHGPPKRSLGAGF